MDNTGKIELKSVTLAAMTSVRLKPTIKAMEYSMRGVKFADSILITHEKPSDLPDSIRYKHIDKFNYSMVYDLYKYIDTEFALIIHYDGFVVNPSMWSDEFLEYDYIGAPWPLPPEDDKITYRDINGNLCRVGNSVSIRSRRLMELPSKINMPWEPFHGWYNEDGYICCNNRHIFEQYGMKYAPLEVAIRFGQEAMLPEGEGIEPFVFHKWEGRNAKYPNFLPVKERISRSLYGTAVAIKKAIDK